MLRVNKTNFHMKGFALGLETEAKGNSEIAYWSQLLWTKSSSWSHKQAHVFLLRQYAGEEYHSGMPCLKFVRTLNAYRKKNTYTFYVTKDKPYRPIRYIMHGYDTLLHSFYDHYVIDYLTFHEWKFNFRKMKIPKGETNMNNDKITAYNVRSYWLDRKIRTWNFCLVFSVFAVVIL